jgi:hypothetical protein
MDAGIPRAAKSPFQRTLTAGAVVIAALLIAALLPTLLGAVFAVYVAPRIEQGGRTISVEEAVGISRATIGLSVVAAVVIASILCIRLRRR